MNNSVNDTLAQRELEALAQAIKFFGDWWAKTTVFFTSYHWREILFTVKLISIIISWVPDGTDGAETSPPPIPPFP